MSRAMWWGDWTFSRPAELSILDLVKSRTLDFKLAGLLWLIMESRASVLVASGPIFAGKTTLLHSLLDLLPPGLHKYTLQGFAEDFGFTERCKPETTYLVSEEISNHQYDYLWGPQVQKTFRLLAQGYRLGATIHSRDIRDVVHLLHGHLKVPLRNIARLGAVVTLHAANGRSPYDEPIRRIDMVNIVNMGDGNLVAQTLAARESLDGGFIYPEENALREALFDKFGIKCEGVFSEIDSRAIFLQQLYDSGACSREDVKKATADYYHAHPPR
jgi:hypothetical protein